MNTVPKPLTTGRAVRLNWVCDLTGSSRATVWRWVKGDPAFPRPFKLSEGVTVWDEGEVLDWIEVKKSKRGVR
jgi:prophage regulatory protein